MGQRLMQASSDIFLGWLRAASGLDAEERDFYVRQLRDWKGSADIDRMDTAGMTAYARVCAEALARTRAQRRPRRHRGVSGRRRRRRVR